MKVRECEVGQHAQECFDLKREFARPHTDAHAQKQLSPARHYARRVAAFAHSHLYCRDPNEALTASETNVLLSERQKYLSHINKHFKRMIPEELSSKRAMKAKAAELLRRLREAKRQRECEEELRANKRRRRVTEQPKAEPPSKRLKKSEADGEKKEQSGKVAPHSANRDPIANTAEVPPTEQ
jgi:hypothetical protein